MTASQEKAIKDAITALNDWVLTYAPEWCDKKAVDEARKRIWDNGGTLAYITDVRESLEKTLC